LASIYSTQLASGLLSDGSPHTIYTAPAAGTVIIRDIELCFFGTGPGSINIRLPSTVIFTIQSDVPSPFEYVKSCRIVMNPSDTIVIQAGEADWSYVLSGYVLSS
jgi:hypothetical protein